MSWKGDFIHAGIDTDGKKLRLTGLGGGFATTNLMGAGTAASPATFATAGNALQFYFKSTYASGGVRGLYLRTYFEDGSSGDCARIFSTVNESTGTVQGAHISLSFATGAIISGQGIAMRATLHVPNEVMGAFGTYAATQSEVFMDGTSSDPSAATQFTLHRFVVAGGDATARDRVKKLFSIEGVTSGAANMIQTGQSEPTWSSKTCLIRILVGGTPMNLIAVDPS